MSSALTKGERRVLDGAAHCARFGWNFCTGRGARKSDALRLIKRGFLEDGGLAIMVDGDGFSLEPERVRQSYRLTPSGHALAERLDAEAHAAFVAGCEAIEAARASLLGVLAARAS